MLQFGMSICHIAEAVNFGFVSMFLSLGISVNSTQLLWRNETTFYKPQSIISFNLCERDALHCRMQMVVTHLTERVTLKTDPLLYIIDCS